MTIKTTKALKVILAGALLLAQAACTSSQSTPNMVDYSYVPASKGISVVAQPGIQDF